MCSANLSTSPTPPPARSLTSPVRPSTPSPDLWRLITADRAEGREPEPTTIGEQQRLLRSAVVLGAQATAARSGKTATQTPRAVRPPARRRDDYLRFVADPRVPFDNNAAEQTIRMPKTTDQGLRLHAPPHRSRTLRRDSQLHRNRHPARRRLARRTHPSHHRQPLDPHHRLNPAPNSIPVYPRKSTYPVTKEILPDQPWDMGHKPQFELWKHQESSRRPGYHPRPVFG